MAIPIRYTLTCPNCGTTDEPGLADVSVGPHGRTSDTPTYAMLGSPLWSQTRRDGETWLSCTTCGAADFVTVNHMGRRLPVSAMPKGKPS